MLAVGVRVVRGPDWQWGQQDDGEGHVGTVVELGQTGSSTSPDKTVVVRWDSGATTNYRVGYNGSYDLRVYDNAPAGVKHQNIICDGCKKHGITGMRWKCTHCYDYDLCTHCYMADKHDTGHVFQRFETANSPGVEMFPRKGCIKLQLRGIFVGAKVVRGPDWDWNNQDGGEGKTGRVIDIRGWDNESDRSVANVSWATGSTNVYRLGHKGKVDLKYVQVAVGGNYYREHLPILGQGQENVLSGPTRPVDAPRHLTFNVGDKVKVLMDVDTLKHMQDGHGGWNPRMAAYIGKIGTVHRVTERGDIRVQYEGCNNRWTFHPGTLTKINTFDVGDWVKVRSDVAHVKEHQKGHGEWIEVMKSTLGKLGKVVKIYDDGDLRVHIEGTTWTFNPLCVQLVPESATEINNSMQGNQQREDHANPLASLLSNLALEQQTDNSGMERMVREAAQGHLEAVRDFFKEFPAKVDCKCGGKSCLQVACHQGHIDIVKLLLQMGASLDVPDDEGDTALHYSAFGNQPPIMELLLRKGADIDAVNKSRCSALHVAVNKQYFMCVTLLLKFKCNVNIQDSYDDTALHDAIGKESKEIIDLLCSVPGIDFTLKNKRGFNVLQYAALKGNNIATEKLILRARQLVDVKKDDGFAALHLAALNGHRAVAETLLVQGQADVNLVNNRRQTPLILAVSQGHCSVVELLVSMNADVNAADEDGDTALHIVLMKKALINTEIHELEAPTIYGIWTQIVARLQEHSVALALACYLVQEGCLLSKTNNKEKTPLDLEGVMDTPLVDLLQQYVTPRSIEVLHRAGSGDNSESTTLSPNECTICSEPGENVQFEPCGHRIACEVCASRMKKCLKCGRGVVNRIATDGRPITTKSVQQPNLDRMRYLESKMAELEEAHNCSICMERRRNVAFLCGHGACEKCSATLKVCHMCRKTITKKINLY